MVQSEFESVLINWSLVILWGLMMGFIFLGSAGWL